MADFSMETLKKKQRSLEEYNPSSTNHGCQTRLWDPENNFPCYKQATQMYSQVVSCIP